MAGEEWRPMEFHFPSQMRLVWWKDPPAWMFLDLIGPSFDSMAREIEIYSPPQAVFLPPEAAVRGFPRNAYQFPFTGANDAFESVITITSVPDNDDTNLASERFVEG